MFRRTLHRVCALFTLALAPATVRADDYAGYRIPEFRRQSLSMRTDAARSASGAASANFGIERWSWSGSTGGSYVWESQSDPMTTRFSASVDANVARGHIRQERTFSDDSFELLDLHQPHDSYDASLIADRTWFAPSGITGLTASASVSHGSNQRREDVDRRSRASGSRGESESRYHERVRGSLVTAGLAPGIGRVRDISAVVSARAIEDRLRRMGRVQRELTSDERQHLAQVISLGSSGFSLHDRPLRYLWREVSRVLQTSGALVGPGFDAEAVERSQEPILPFRPFASRIGTRLEVTASLARQDFTSDADFSNDSRQYLADTLYSQSVSQGHVHDRREFESAIWELSLVHAQPSGLLAQWDLSSQLTRRDGPSRPLELRNQLLYQRLWLDRTTLSVAVQHGIASGVVDGRRTLPEWSYSCRMALDYRVEDSWVLQLSWNTGRSMYRNTLVRSSGNSATSNHSSDVSIGLSWRPATWFHSDALDIHERRGRL